MSEYNAALDEEREDEQITTYQLIPDANKHIDDGHVFIHFSFKQMIYLLFQFNYDGNKKKDYIIENELLGNQSVKFNQDVTSSVERLLESVFRLEEPFMRLR